MKKSISTQYSLLYPFWRRTIFVSVIFSFVFPLILNAEIQTGSFDFDGRNRSYKVYLPPNYTDSTNFPLVICLHPYGRTAEFVMNYTNFNQVADASDFIIVYPSAIPNWNSGIADNPIYPTPDVDDVGFINALIDIMSNSYSIDRERIYACGFSNGGFMSYKLACQLGNRIAAIASVGAVIATSTAESCSPVRAVPVLNIFGTADPYLPVNGGTGWYSVDQTLSYWINFNDCVQTDTTILPDLDPTDGCTVEKITYTNCFGNCNVVYYKVINGGHTWPGANPLSMGNTNQDIDASVEIWNFFKNHKLVITPVVDFNGDGFVDTKDLLRVIESWGQDDSVVDIAPPPFGDGVVDVLDLELLMSYWEQPVDDLTLIAHWALDETEGIVVADSVGENDGYALGEPVWQSDGGIVNGALQLDGIDDYVSTPRVLNPAYGSFSIFAWINGGAPAQVILSQTDKANWLCTDSVEGYLMTELRNPDRGGKTLQSQTNITDGNWHRIGFVSDSTNRVLYVDDVAVAQDIQQNLGGSDSGLYIGCGKGMEPGTYWSGLIDDVRIYRRAIIP